MAKKNVCPPTLVLHPSTSFCIHVYIPPHVWTYFYTFWHPSTCLYIPLCFPTSFHILVHPCASLCILVQLSTSFCVFYASFYIHPQPPTSKYALLHFPTSFHILPHPPTSLCIPLLLCFPHHSHPCPGKIFRKYWKVTKLSHHVRMVDAYVFYVCKNIVDPQMLIGGQVPAWPLVTITGK